MSKVHEIAIALLCLVALLGCGGGDDDSSTNNAKGGAGMGSAGKGGSAGNGAPAATFTQIFDMMYPMATNARCTACHSQPPFDVANGNLSMGMDKASAYKALFGVKSTSSKCGGMTYLDPGKPESSLLYLKLTATPPCGVRMPNGGNMFTPDQLEMVHGWIAAGAKDD
jgi:hypothetical protein